MGQLSSEDQYYLAENFMAIFNRDYRRIAELHVQAGWMPSHIRIDELEAAARSVCEPYFTRPLSEISLAEVLVKLFRTAQRYELTLQPQLILLQKTLLNIEGVGRLLDPKLDIWAVARPVLRTHPASSATARSGWRSEFRKRLPEMVTHAPDMPRLLHAWLTQQVEGKHTLQMRSQRPRANWRRRSARGQRRTVARDPRHRAADRRGGAVWPRSRRPARARRAGVVWIAALGGAWALLAAWPRRRERWSAGRRCGEAPYRRSRERPVSSTTALAVVDKPAGLMVHDSALARGETDFAADRLREQFGKPIFLVHRLDRATSGCLLLAFDRETASALGKTLMSRDVEKDYLRGLPRLAGGRALHHRPSARRRPGQAAEEAGDHRVRTPRRPANSNARPRGFPTSRYALLRAHPQTGRFRQIRRHLKHVSHHLIGDTSHGDGRHNRAFRMLGIHRMLLHARRLAFDASATGARIEVRAPVDAEFARALAARSATRPDA